MSRQIFRKTLLDGKNNLLETATMRERQNLEKRVRIGRLCHIL